MHEIIRSCLPELQHADGLLKQTAGDEAQMNAQKTLSTFDELLG